MLVTFVSHNIMKTLNFCFALLVVIVSTISPVSPLSQGSIIVDGNGTQLTFTDSGAPASYPYTTVFAVNGMGFNGGIFSKIQTLAPSQGLRIVAVNRRGYAGSTTYSTQLQSFIFNGTAAQQTEFYRITGTELLTFMDTFIQQNNIPEFDGKNNHGASAGGVVVLGWSIGNMETLAAIANIQNVSPATTARLASRIRTLIMQGINRPHYLDYLANDQILCGTKEPSVNALGLPAPAQEWVPLDIVDPTIPAADQYTAFAQWVTAYFDHGNLSSRDPNVISWVVPSSFTPFTIFNMTRPQYNSIIDTSDNSALDASQFALAPALKSNYRAANFNSSIRNIVPQMKNWFITGTRSASFGPYAIWDVKDDNAAAGGEFVNFLYVDGVNHLMHWDYPELTLSVYQRIISS